MTAMDAQRIAAMTAALEEMANGRTLQDAAKAQGDNRAARAADTSRLVRM